MIKQKKYISNSNRTKKNLFSLIIKHIYFFIVFLIGGNIFASGDNKLPDPDLKAQAKQWVSMQSPMGFLENKGQMTDIDGKPTPYILFKAEAPGMNMYVTEQGLSYMFIKMEEEHNSSTELVLRKSESLSGTFEESAGLEEMNERIKVEYSRVDMSLPGASIKKKNIITEGASDWVNHYYTDSGLEGIRDVHGYKKIIVKEIYPRIDWVLYNSGNNGFKYDFIVHPGADPKQIKLVYRSEKDLSIDKEGNINIKTSLGTLTENTPICYIDETRDNVHAKFIKKSSSSTCGTNLEESEISFSLDNYNTSKTLIIDPQLWWGTYIYNTSGGGSSVGPMSIDSDLNGNVYITGYTGGNIPLMPWGSAYYVTLRGQMFVLRFTNTGVLTWCTYLGAHLGVTDHSITPAFITIDNAGNIYIVGHTFGQIDSAQPWGSAYYDPTFNPGGSIAADGFIMRFSNTGTLQWATHFGGSEIDVAASINIASNGNMYVTGYTQSTDFPLQAWGTAYFDNSINGVYDAFVAGFDNAGQLIWSTYFGGSSFDNGNSITTDLSGNIYFSGETRSGNFPIQTLGGAYNDPTFNGGTGDAFVTKFNNTGQLQWSTYLGGSSRDRISTIGTDPSNNLFVTGMSQSANFPTQTWGTAYFDGALSGGQDVFIDRFDPAGIQTWSTFFGGSNLENDVFGFDNIEFDNCGNLYFAFHTQSADITTYKPVCASYIDNSYGGGTGSFSGDVFITKFSSRTGNLLWATYLGASGDDFRNALAVDPNNDLFITGEWMNYSTVAATSALPCMNPGGGALFNNTSTGTVDKGYILKFTPDPPPTYLQSQVNSGSCVCTGTATVNTSCGIAPFNYIWSNGVQSLTNNNASYTATALCPGSYWVKVTDDACNRDTAYYSITGTAGSVSATGTQTNVKCNSGNNGTATVSVTGGAPPYTYSWSSGHTSAGVTGLTSGSYNVTIKDADGCTYQQVFIITQTTPVFVYVAGYTQVTSCNANAGSITMNASGGTPTYTYNWNNGQTSQTATGLVQGNYTVTVTDVNGCSSIQIAAVTSIPPPNFTLTTTNGTCGNGGRGSVTTSGGTAPYTYAWTNGSTTQSTFGLVAGNHTVTVTDTNGCSGTKTFSITDTPNLAIATFTQSPAGTVCVGTPIIFTNTGTPPGTGVTYNWLISTITPANVSGTSTNFFYTFLSPGTYSISHTVGDGTCSKNVSSNITVVDCTGPSVTASSSSICRGSCAIVTSSGSGGSAPYTYSWSNGAITQNISPCPATTTTYTVIVIDAGGSTSTSTAVVTINPAVTVTATATNITCNGIANGSVTATAGGGSPAFTYNWSTGATTSQISSLTSQIYTVTVTDNKGCTSVSAASVISPSALAGQFAKGAANCTGCGCKEWIMATATGGTSPYTYLWPDGYVNRYKNQLCPGNYSINIKDKNGCSVNVNIKAP